MVSRYKYENALATIRQYNRENRAEVYEDFANRVANILGSDIEEVRQHNRQFYVMSVRRIVVEMLRRRFKDIDPVKIGKVIKRDRTSILYMVRTHNDHMIYNEYSSLVRKVEIEI